jgi:hypothetical protein
MKQPFLHIDVDSTTQVFPCDVLLEIEASHPAEIASIDQANLRAVRHCRAQPLAPILDHRSQKKV